MGVITPVTDHVAAGLAKLAGQYKDKPNLAALLTVYLTQVQEVEDAVADLAVMLTLDGAVGVWLDLLGKIVGQARNGLGDEDYRIEIRAKIRVNRSGGTIEDVLAVFEALRAGPLAGATFEVTEAYPASFILKINGAFITDSQASRYARFLKDARPVAVQSNLEFTTAEDAETFSFFDGPGLGFGDSTNPATGGKLAGIL